VIDCHLMVTDPAHHLAEFARSGADSVTFHVEATDDAAGVAATVREHGLGVGVSFNPGTPPERAAAAAELAAADLVLLMSIRPGYSGQPFMPEALDRVARLAELATRSAGLDRFLGDLQLAERVEVDEDISGPARRVALSSVHQAKGLEWSIVFVLQVESGAFPSGWAVSEGNLDEEERLFYVAVTRAADELYLCRPIAARRPWDTGPDAVVINSGQGFLDRDLGGPARRPLRPLRCGHPHPRPVRQDRRHARLPAHRRPDTHQYARRPAHKPVPRSRIDAGFIPA